MSRVRFMTISNKTVGKQIKTHMFPENLKTEKKFPRLGVSSTRIWRFHPLKTDEYEILILILILQRGEI